uniref:Kit ligand n=1 Tax=Anabas testudineus TaxID=64144 RepID=A0A3Q1H9N1_ANATE
MKKSKIWIHVCVHLLLFITLGVHSSILDVNPVTDDISRLAVLRQNIPKDYKIPVHYIPKEEGGMCWVTLNVFYLEKSLDDLAAKFGNISSNKKDISIFIQMLQELRINMGSLDEIMMDYECHYRQERWQTARYFDFVKDFLIAAQNRNYSDDCEPPTCPTTPYIVITDDQDLDLEPRILSDMMERSLLSLLFIPLLAFVFLLVWKVRSRGNQEDFQQNPEEGGTEATAPPLDAEISEKIKLNVIETV